MKRFLLAILLLTVLFFVKAQEINKLDASKIRDTEQLWAVETYSLHYSLVNSDFVESDRTVKFYQIVDRNNKTALNFDIFNLDLSLYKTVNIICPDGYVPSNVGFVTTNMFNTDEKVEFIAEFFQRTDTEYKYIVKLYNEDGVVLYDFISDFPRSASKTIDNTFILRGKNYYTLKPSATKVSAVNIKRNASPYPNPAAQTINLPYQLNPGEQADMQIYDVNGKLISTKRIDATFDKIVLNVSGYEKGMYVYKYNGKSAKFVVE